ncbi:MAG: hypothetical protein QM773_18835 [Hyphomonadaceae bacterium]
MFEGTGMTTQSPEQPGDLERMFADEEGAIRDDGFTSRVMEQAQGGFGWRRTIIYGAGMAGFGAALAGIMEMSPYLPNVSVWLGGLSHAVQNTPAPDPSSPMVLIVGALVAGLTFLALAVAAQER